MKIEEILTLPTEEQLTILKQSKGVTDYTTIAAQWDVDKHDVTDTNKRPWKAVKRAKDTPNTYGGSDYETKYEDVNRITIPFQRLIVDRAIGFLLGNPVENKYAADNDQQEQLATMVIKTYEDNKLTYFNRKLARVVMSECEAAELWYLVEDRTFWGRIIKQSANNIFKLKVKILSPSKGDELWPYFDDTGDMVAFSRGYSITDSQKKVTQHFDTWTDTAIYSRISQDGGWLVTITANPLGKIPVVYYSQPEPEWWNVQSLIDRYETKMSNFADTNDYFGSPMVKVIGQIDSLPGKTTQGKVLQLTPGSDASYMSWDSGPESDKVEFDQIEKMIYTMTQTPNISFEQMKSIGGELSGFAIKLMFTDAHLKVENKIELFGEMFQRRNNLVQHICGNVINLKLSSEVNNLYIEPKFIPYLPENVREQIEILSTARGNKSLISNETALENNPLVTDVQSELERIAADTETEAQNMTRELAGTFNPV